MSNSVAIYCRYSTDRQDSRSIDDQLRRCREFARSRGFEVVTEYQDAAQSGAHLDRADMRRMLADARRRGGSPFSAVLVDDLSRLSRDLGNTWRVVFEDLASVAVRVIDVTTGMASDGAGARLTFGALALVNDAFLQLVKTETHRGLEGRALAGFWTGGKVYGYQTEKEPTPPDPEHPRSIVKVNDSEAKVVRRIFALYAQGDGLGRIASLLNHEGIPAPYDHKASKKRGRGWSASTIRAMLTNERYVGRFVWNKRQFIRVPNQKHRRAIMRPPSQWRVKECPELAIIAQETWAAVQARFSTRAPSQRGRPLGASRHVHLFSGIARCGIYNAGMGVVGQHMKKGKRYSTFGCSAKRHRGDAICSNGLTVSERKLDTALLGAIRDHLLAPGALQRFVGRFNEHLIAARKAQPDQAAAQLDRELREAEAAVANLTQAVAQAGWSKALGEKLRAEEARLEALR